MSALTAHLYLCNVTEGASLPADEVQRSQNVRPEEGVRHLAGGPSGPRVVLRAARLADTQRDQSEKVCRGQTCTAERPA